MHLFLDAVPKLSRQGVRGRVDEVRGTHSEVSHELSPQRIIDLPPVLRCVCEASYVESLRRLLERGFK